MAHTQKNQFTSLEIQDPAVFDAIEHELDRQQNQLELIASENIVSAAVLEAQGSIMTNKYAEGYPARRYYGGCEFVDVAENLAINRAKQLFNCEFANVQPHSGSQANQAVLLALLTPGDKILGMSMDAGGHLTHGSSVNLSGKWFKSVTYGVSESDGRIDYDAVEEIALREKPQLIIAGGSAYPRIIDFARFKSIAQKSGAYLMVDMAHFAGLVAGGAFPSPLPHADVVTTTTHKTLRGPRGGMVLTNNPEIAKKINSAIFPGLQGGPLMHIIAAKAVAFNEALQPAFKAYATSVIENAQALAKSLEQRGYPSISGGTDSHLILVDLRRQGIKGKEAEILLDHAGITCNKNGVPFDPLPPTITSGIRLGSPACTTRGLTKADFTLVANLIADVLDRMAEHPEETTAVIEQVRTQVKALCDLYPIYSKGSKA